MGKKLGIAALVVGALALVAVGAVAALVLWKPATVEDWVGRQVVGIANSYLVPRLNYKTVEYHAPGDVVLTGVTLTAPDGTRVLDVGRMGVTLAEIPRRGQPIVIERITLEQGEMNLVRDPRGGFRGLSPITRNGEARKDVPSNFRLSNVLRLKLVDLHDCAIRYEQGGGTPPMILRGITSKLEIAPTKDAGWYGVQLEGGREPAASMQLAGRINLDTYTIEVRQGMLRTQLDPQTAQTLPPEVQQLLKEYDAAGTASIGLSGMIPLMDLAKGDANASVNITNFSFAAGGYRLPMQQLAMSARLANGVLVVPDLDAGLLGGRMTGAFRLDLSKPSRRLDGKCRVVNLDLEQMHRDPRAAKDPKKIIGILSGGAEAAMELTAGRTSLDGGGTVSVRRGRLFALPGFMDVLGLLDRTLVSKVSSATTHEGDAEFRLRPEGVEFTRSEVRTDLTAARATGLVGFDERLDLTVNAGPLEKLQSLLGGVGKAIGAVSDKLVTYRIRGTMKAPKVSVDVMGG